jgi:hypothetical protein
MVSEKCFKMPDYRQFVTHTVSKRLIEIRRVFVYNNFLNYPFAAIK